jgi:uncharacterized protein YndB with AHSA1/START domain
MNEPIIIVQVINAPIEKVWKAITDKDEMEKWYFNFSDFKLEPGFEFQFTGGTENKQYLHLCKITDIIPLERLSYSWRYEGYPGNTIVTFELRGEKDKTRLRLTHSGLETFPVDNPDFARHNFEAGWGDIIGTSLLNFVENKAA